MSRRRIALFVAVVASTAAALPGVAAAEANPVDTARLVYVIADADPSADEHEELPPRPVVELTNGRILNVDPADVPAGATAGATVAVAVADDHTANVLALVKEAPAAAVSGARSILVVTVTWPGAATPPPSPSAVTTSFAAGATWYDSASRGKLTWSPTTGPTVNVGSPIAFCSMMPNQVANLVDAGVRGNGIEPNNFNHVAYLMPGDAACGWSGLAYMPGRISVFNNSMNTLVVTHELGHNLGLGHGNYLSCRNDTATGYVTVQPTEKRSTHCRSEVYSDFFTTMGNRAAGTFTAPHLNQLGWFGPGEKISGTAGTSTCLAPLAGSAHGAPLTVTIAVPGVGTVYLENRQPVGVDLAMETSFWTRSMLWKGIQAHVPVEEVNPTTGVTTSHRITPDRSKHAYVANSPGLYNDDIVIAPNVAWAVPHTDLTVTVGTPANGCVPVSIAGPTPLTAPSAPTAVTASPGNANATVTWDTPASDGGSPITGYTATASPSGASCSTTVTACVVTGLPNGVPQTFTVRATNAVGASIASAPSAPVTPTADPAPPLSGSGFEGVTPKRILDSRDGTGGFASAWPANQSRSVTVTGGSTTVDPSATAVVLNVTAVNPPNATFVSVYPTAQNRPHASNLNLPANEVRPNQVTVKVGAGGKVDFWAQTSVHLVADVVGYYSPTGTGLYTGMTPNRILDSRFGTGGYVTPWGAAGQQERELRVAGGSTGVPLDAEAVIMNVTVTSPTTPSVLTVFPGDKPRPVASHLNYGPGQTVSNLVTVAVPTTGVMAGKVKISNLGGTVDVIADVVGYFSPTAGGRFEPLTPHRILDSRDGTGGYTKPWAGQASHALTARGAATTVPSDAKAVVVNITGVTATADTYVTAWPSGLRPLASNLNLPAGDTRANLAVVRLDGTGSIRLFNHAGNTHLIVDVVGYFT